MPTNAWKFRLLAAAVALGLAGVACSSGGGKHDTKAGTADTTPEERRAPASEVAAGLGKIDVVVGQINQSIGQNDKTAREQAEGLQELWYPIEGTIRANDTDQYLRFEDDIATLRTSTAAGDVARTQTAAADLSDAVKAYLAKYPG